MCKIDDVSILVLLISLSTSQLLDDDPTGDKSLKLLNISEIEELPCYVNNLQRDVDCLVCPKPEREQDDVTIGWIFIDQPISRGLNVLQSGYKASLTQYSEIKLTIKSISEHNVGTYYCNDYSNGPKTIRTYKIILKSKPIIANANTTLVVQEGNTIALWCNATSPVPMNKYNTSWYLHSNDSDRSIGITGNKLEIQNITRHCGAIYRCIARNVKGKTHLDFTVTVQFAPSLQIVLEANESKVTLPQTNQRAIKLNTNILMKCWVSSEPETTSIQWYKSDKLVGEWNKTTFLCTQEEYKQRYALMKESRNDYGYPTLGLKFTSTNEDFDTFWCVASNVIGTKSEFVTFVKL